MVNKRITRLFVAIAAVTLAANASARGLSDGISKDDDKTVVVILDSNNDRIRTGIDEWGDDCRMSVYMLTDSAGEDACGYSFRIDEAGRQVGDEPYSARLDDIYNSGMRVVDLDKLLTDGQTLDDVQKAVRANVGKGKGVSYLLIDKAEISDGNAVVRPVGETVVFPYVRFPR